MTTSLPLVALVLYKHGVGTFTREGTVEGESLELPFRAADVDDALKSLIVSLPEGGQVTGMRYATPRNSAERLAELPIHIGPKHALFDLLRSLRGTRIEVHSSDGVTRTGRVIGVEEHPQGHEHGATLVLFTDAGSAQQIATGTIDAVHLADERMAGAVDGFLRTSAAEEEHRSIHLALSAAGTRVRATFTIPSPVWRVSYRLVGETADSQRRALLQGWAIFDNHLDESLNGVDVTLVAGQPVSFRYDLTSSITPERPLVRDEARVAAGPIEYDAMPSMAEAAPAAYMQSAAFEPRFQRKALSRLSLEDDVNAVQHTTAGIDAGELFEYHVGNVTVGQGESAMLSIAQHIGPYSRELLYNGAKHSRNPVASIRLTNATGLTLERGPITVLEDGQYRGEAMLPFTRPNSEILLPYAVELGVIVHESLSESRTSNHISLHGAYLKIEEFLDRSTAYVIENNTPGTEDITIESEVWHGSKFNGTRKPDFAGAEYQRWVVPCTPGKSTRFTLSRRLPIERHESIMDDDLHTLSDYLQNRSLDGEVHDLLRTVLRLRGDIAESAARIEKLQEERTQLGIRQDRLRKNLSIVAANPTEEDIRARSAADFRRTQDRDDEIDVEIESIIHERNRAQSELDDLLASLD